MNMNKKYQHQIEFIGYKMISRAATNVFKVENLEDGGISYISGDHLIVTSLTETQMRDLIIKLRSLDQPVQPERPLMRSAAVSTIIATVKLRRTMRKREKRRNNSERRKDIRNEGGIPERCFDVCSLYNWS